jgi:Tol biopolymer transport system component/DNA-binding winged helix-turn-helix (wHTH) protein
LVATPAHTTSVWRFGVFEVDARRGEFRRAGVTVRLREQSFTVLILLLEHAGELVTREELRTVLWPVDTFVDFDHSLNAAVMRLREALGDTADKPLYIETIPKQGYRFIAPLAGTSNPSAPIQFSDAAESTASVRPVRYLRFRHYRWAVAGASIALAAAAATVWYERRPLPPPRVSDYVQITNDGIKKDIAGTDGRRLYLNLEQTPGIAGMAAGGGPIGPISLNLPNLGVGDVPTLVDVSRDGSQLLVLGGWHERERNYDIWVVRSEGESARLFSQGVDAAWSPDGHSIAFIKRSGDLYVSPGDGDDIKQIFKCSGQFGPHPGHLRWSPDGKTIRFTSGYTSPDAIWEISADGRNLHELFPEWHGSVPYCCGRWTPDGAFYVFLAGSSLSETYWYMSRTAEIWVLDERHEGIRRRLAKPVPLTPGPIRWGEPVPSEDGRRIFARGKTLRGELVRFNPSFKEWEPWLGGISAEAVAFSADGRYVAYVTYPERILWRANRDGTGKLQLTQRPLTPVQPHWSPDGSQILFTSIPDNGASLLYAPLYTVPSMGGASVRVIPDDPESEGDATWSPDGKKITYCPNRWLPGQAEGKNEIKILDLTTHATTAIVSDREIFNPRWSPDGRYILVTALNQVDLLIFDLEKRAWSTFSTGGAASWTTWSRNSRYVYFRRDGPEGRSGIYRMFLANGEPEQVVDLKGFRDAGMFGQWFGLDPEDTPLQLRDVGSDELYSLSLAR